MPNILKSAPLIDTSYTHREGSELTHLLSANPPQEYCSPKTNLPYNMKHATPASCHLAPVHVDSVEDARHNLSEEQQISTLPAITPSMRTWTQQQGEHQFYYTKENIALTSCCIVLILGGDEEVYRTSGAKEHRNPVPKENNKTLPKTPTNASNAQRDCPRRATTRGDTIQYIKTQEKRRRMCHWTPWLHLTYTYKLNKTPSWALPNICHQQHHLHIKNQPKLYNTTWPIEAPLTSHTRGRGYVSLQRRNNPTKPWQPTYNKVCSWKKTTHNYITSTLTLTCSWRMSHMNGVEAPTNCPPFMCTRLGLKHK